MASEYLGKPCPKCRYVRTASDIAPDWQCPKCGIAYAKFVQAQTQPVATMARPANPGRAAAEPGEGGSTGLAVFSHASILIGGIIPLINIIVPVAVWIVKSDKDEFAVGAAKEAINFQISALLWGLLVVGVIFAGAIAHPLFWIGMLLLVALLLAMLILPIVAITKTSSGERFRYPWTVHIFE
jgi:uncharacterized Tic20 family protein